MRKFVLMITISYMISFIGSPAFATDALPGLWNVYLSVFKEAKYIDLTHAFEPVQPVWPGFGHAQFKPAKAGKQIAEYVEVGEEFTYEKHGFVLAEELPDEQWGTVVTGQRFILNL